MVDKNNDGGFHPANLGINVRPDQVFRHQVSHNVIRTQSSMAWEGADKTRSACTFLLLSGLDLIPSIDNAFLVIICVYILDVFVRLFGLGWKSYRANGWNLFDIVVAAGSFITTIVVRADRAGFLVQQLQKLFLVSIAFKLVQRFDALNMLYKTAVYVFLPLNLSSIEVDLISRASLPVILSLLGLWLILFVFFAIMYMEVFGLTKWSTGETRNQNYSSMGSSLVMLAFMSVGWVTWRHFPARSLTSPRFTARAGTNTCMISMLIQQLPDIYIFNSSSSAITYPRCTNFIEGQLDSDCGSEKWAYSLAIAWNLLSMVSNLLMTNMTILT